MSVNLSNDGVYLPGGEGNDRWRKTGRGSPYPTSLGQGNPCYTCRVAQGEKEDLMSWLEGNRRNINKLFHPGRVESYVWLWWRGLGVERGVCMCVT